MNFALECCEMSYKENIKNFKGYECKLLQSDEDAQAYVFQMKDTTVIAFRGTSSYMDAFTDLNAFSTILPSFFFVKSSVTNNNDIKVHAGFLKQYISLRKQILENIKREKIIVTGHSLGGALSQIAALELSSFADLSCITFGSPRVGNKEFAKFLSEKVPNNLAIVHKLDPIPQLPSFWGWWKHPSTKRLEVSENILTEHFEDKNNFSFNVWNPSKAHTLQSYKMNLIV